MEEKENKNNKVFTAICSTRNSANTTGQWTKCVECNIALWLSDSTLHAIRKTCPELDGQELKINCYCFVHGMHHAHVEKSKGEDVKVITPTTEQIDEVSKALKEKYKP